MTVAEVTSKRAEPTDDREAAAPPHRKSPPLLRSLECGRHPS
jgi:hypothetical protein